MAVRGGVGVGGGGLGERGGRIVLCVFFFALCEYMCVCVCMYEYVYICV